MSKHRTWEYKISDEVVVKFRAPHLMECFDLLDNFMAAHQAAPPGNSVAHWRGVLPSLALVVAATAQNIEGITPETGAHATIGVLQDHFEFADIVLMATDAVKHLHEQVGFATVTKGEIPAPFIKGGQGPSPS